MSNKVLAISIIAILLVFGGIVVVLRNQSNDEVRVTAQNETHNIVSTTIFTPAPTTEIFPRTIEGGLPISSSRTGGS